MRTLKPQRLPASAYSDMERQLKAAFYEMLFRPVVELLAPRSAQVKKVARDMKNSSELANAKYDPIVSGINSGAIQYVDGVFSGNFSSATSKALRSYGAKWNKSTGTFAVVKEDLPQEVLDAAGKYAVAARDLHVALLARLADIQRGLEGQVNKKLVDATLVISKAERSFNSAYGEAIGKVELSEGAREALDREYADNMKLWIKKFSEDTIKELRGDVQENARQGYRFDHLVERIQNRYDVSQTKAEFLARQETSLFVSKHREQRFSEVGITHYVWQTAGDAEVREGHSELNGRTFSFKDKAPARYMSVDQPCNPGEDYNCRCVAAPIVTEELEEALA